MPAVNEPHWELSRPTLVFDNPPAIRDMTWHEIWQRSVAQWTIPDDPFDPASWHLPSPITFSLPFARLVPEPGYRGPIINPNLFAPAPRSSARVSPWQLLAYKMATRGAVIVGGRRPSWVRDMHEQIAELRARRHEQLRVSQWARQIAGEFGTATLTDVETFYADWQLGTVIASGALDDPLL